MADTTTTTTFSATPTVEVLLCDGCRCPIGSVWDVLPAAADAPAWTAHVYSYELDLFANGAAPLQAYSATNPSQRRFDLLRLAPYVTVHCTPAVVTAASANAAVAVEADALKKEKKGEKGGAGLSAEVPGSDTELDAPANTPFTAVTDAATATTTTCTPSFVECSTAVYSSEHSFFTGYAWCFAHCGNCGAFLGWGFAAEGRVRSAARTRNREASRPGNSATSAPRRRVEEDDEDASGEEGDVSGSGDAQVDAEEEDGSPSAASCGGVTPDFIGIIITHCTGEANYPVASLLKEVECRERRVRRREQVQALARSIRPLLRQIDDGLFAQRLHYTMERVMSEGLREAPGSDTDVALSTLRSMYSMARGWVEYQRTRSTRGALRETEKEEGEEEVEEEDVEETASDGDGREHDSSERVDEAPSL